MYQNVSHFANSAILRTKFWEFDESHPVFIYLEIPDSRQRHGKAVMKPNNKSQMLIGTTNFLHGMRLLHDTKIIVNYVCVAFPKTEAALRLTAHGKN